MMTIKIDVRKLDKARFFEGKPDKDRHRPLWCDLVAIERREPGRFGDTHLVKQGCSKEERQAGKQMPILGSATERGGTGQGSPAQQSRPQQALQGDLNDEDVPF
jgi:hypothetical protein